MSRGLRETGLVARREFHALLSTPLFWVLSGVFFLAAAVVYVGLLAGFANPGFRRENDIRADVTLAVISQHFWVLHYFLMIQAPLLTMRTLAEERRHGTLGLLMTTPVPEWSIVAGKFLANIGALVVYFAITLVFPLLTEWISEPDWPVVASCYAALLLSACAYVALGLFFSSITDSQVIAAVLTYVTVFFLLIFSSMTDLLPTPGIALLARHLTVMPHLEGFLEGNILTMDLAYFGLFSFMFLFLAVRQIESLRWRS